MSASQPCMRFPKTLGAEAIAPSPDILLSAFTAFGVLVRKFESSCIAGFTFRRLTRRETGSTSAIGFLDVLRLGSSFEIPPESLSFGAVLGRGGSSFRGDTSGVLISVAELGLSNEEDTVKLLSEALNAFLSSARRPRVFDLRRRLT